MDATTKSKMAAIKELIKKKQFNEALMDLQVLTYKYPKLFQAHLMAGLCYDKVGKEDLAEKCYLQVLDIKQNQPNAVKALCDLYSKKEDGEKATKYLELHSEILKVSDPKKYREQIVSLVKQYEKNEDMEKIDVIFKQYLQNEETINDNFVAIAGSYFRTGVTNQCFFIQNFYHMGVKGETFRPIQPSSRQAFNYLLIDIISYIESVKIKDDLSNKDIANTLYELKQYFPEASCLLMLLLLNEYCISQINFSGLIIQQIFFFLQALYDRVENCYLNLQILDTEIFTVTMLLGYEYIAFFKQFFSLDPGFDKYYEKLAEQVEKLSTNHIRQQYSKVISKYILKQCRTLNRIAETQNVQKKLERLKDRIDKLDHSFLEEVIAKMAMNCFIDYHQLNSMKNMLKVRINNLNQEDLQPHLYKYYYDYILKIAKIFKTLDEEKSIYSILEYITKHDPIDFKYQLQYWWIQFSKSVKPNNLQYISKIHQQLQIIIPKVTGRLKAQAIRKLAIIKIFLSKTDILDDFKLALGIDRCFENIQSIAFQYFISKDYGKALTFLKEAFILNQSHYHLNRLIVICLIKEGNTKDAYNFIERIYEGFSSVFWVNYMLAMNSISTKKLFDAEKYLTAAIEAFKSGVEKSYKFSYEKTYDMEMYSLFYMIQQNQYTIFHDQYVIPETIIYENCPLVSSLIFEKERDIMMIKINTQLGQVLKVLGRTKSSYNYLSDAYSIICQMPEQQKQSHKVAIIIAFKEFASILFYMGYFKESEAILKLAHQFCKDSSDNSLNNKISSEISSLLFQVSVERLSYMMKFQSYETVHSYINSIPSYQTDTPSLNFYKSKYQFCILNYLHDPSVGVKFSLQAIHNFLSHLKLDPTQTSSIEFYNRLLQLSEEQKELAKECLEDYYILKYINSCKDQNNAIQEASILPLIQIFPRSTVFYIIYGMAIKNIKLKIAAFLKCIQLDRESPISVDLLASLYLKEKDYLTACKLFLKSLQIDLFNPKCYIGLCVCLHSIICRIYSKPSQEEHKIIKQCLNRINSYMEFLRYIDPSQKYQILKFLKILVSQEGTSLLQIKNSLEYSKNYSQKQKLLSKLLEKTAFYTRDFNVWKMDDFPEIVNRYIKENLKGEVSDKQEICAGLFEKIKLYLKDLQKYKDNTELKIKISNIIINKLCIIVGYAKTGTFTDKIISQTLSVTSHLPEPSSEESKELARKFKQLLFSYIIEHQFNEELIHQIQTSVFPTIPTYEYLLSYLHQIPNIKNLLHRLLLLNPSNHTIRKAMNLYLLSQKGCNLKKLKNINYKMEILNSMNSDESANSMIKQHKKMILLYNDYSGWLSYISQNWNDQRLRSLDNVKGWIKILIKLSNSFEGERKDKCSRLKLQMIAFLSSFGQNYETQLNDKQKIIIQVLSLINRKKQIKPQSLAQIVKIDLPESEKQWIIMHILTYIVHNYEPHNSLYQVFDNIINLIPIENKSRGFCQLLRFLFISNRSAETEDDLVTILKDLMGIVSQCEEMNNVHSNSIITMKCIIAILKQQLEGAISQRFATYSDQLLINYFEIIKAYKDLETNANIQGVYDNFILFIDQIILFAKEPFYKGFFLSLKAMAKGIISSEEQIKLGREMKQSLLLSPHQSKYLIH